MATLTYQIEFFDYWHAGTGLVSSGNSDALVQKDENNFPFIPAKTLKGLLREAAEILVDLHPVVTHEFINSVFGIRRKEKVDKDVKRNKAEAFFRNATVSRNLAEKVSKSNTKFLYQQLASTAIGDDGQAKDYSLRNIEVTIPLILYAKIFDFDENYRESIKVCFQWVKKMGLNRNRGLGRCEFSLIKIEN